MKRKILNIEFDATHMTVTLDSPVEKLPPMLSTLAQGSEARKFITQTLNRRLTRQELCGYEPEQLIGQFHDTEGYVELVPFSSQSEYERGWNDALKAVWQIAGRYPQFAHLTSPFFDKLNSEAGLNGVRLDNSEICGNLES